MRLPLLIRREPKGRRTETKKRIDRENRYRLLFFM
jgi:hypothetical protein